MPFLSPREAPKGQSESLPLFVYKHTHKMTCFPINHVPGMKAWCHHFQHALLFCSNDKRGWSLITPNTCSLLMGCRPLPVSSWHNTCRAEMFFLFQFLFPLGVESPCGFLFFKFLIILSNLLGWHWLIKLHRFQVYSSMIHHLLLYHVFTTPSQSPSTTIFASFTLSTTRPPFPGL